jgi:hypothetical protein
MTTAETRERLAKAGLTDQQALGIADALEEWEHDRGVSRDYLDARIADVRRHIAEAKADLKGWMVTVLPVQTSIIFSAVYFIRNDLPRR